MVWVVMTWIPGLAGSPLHALIGIPIMPVIAPFSFLALGPVGFGPLVPLLLLQWLEGWLGRASGIEAPPAEVEPVPEPDSHTMRD